VVLVSYLIKAVYTLVAGKTHDCCLLKLSVTFSTLWAKCGQNAVYRAELAKLRRIGLLVVDEVGYIPFEQDAANLFFQLVSSRYEHASLILTSNLPFARWGDVFGDQVVAPAMIDRIVHHADVLTTNGTQTVLT
jgi:DNA replication protein DnaC